MARLKSWVAVIFVIVVGVSAGRSGAIGRTVGASNTERECTALERLVGSSQWRCARGIGAAGWRR